MDAKSHADPYARRPSPWRGSLQMRVGIAAGEPVRGRERGRAGSPTHPMRRERVRLRFGRGPGGDSRGASRPVGRGPFMPSGLQPEPRFRARNGTDRPRPPGRSPQQRREIRGRGPARFGAGRIEATTAPGISMTPRSAHLMSRASLSCSTDLIRWRQRGGREREATGDDVGRQISVRGYERLVLPGSGREGSGAEPTVPEVETGQIPATSKIRM